ncbi:cation:proton antiporter [Streptomyces eurythermus]|uniref:cation:proton antiporter n=1 Tax=Streptomyces eurythermus TaxID=42237 RepID=UPI0036B5A35D
MGATETVRLLAALTTVCVVAHGCGFLFAALRQPPVIGEIVGGILLGPSFLGLFAPGAVSALFPTSGPVAHGLDALHQLGQLLLLFLAGAELRVRAGGRERRTGAAVATAGLVLPFAAGAGIVLLTGPGRFAGPAGTTVTTALVVGLAMAVAAIPVISRIMMDLGIMDTVFGRIVLMVAVVEDIILYVVLAVVLGLAQAGAEQSVGLWQEFGSTSLTASALYFTGVSLVFVGLALARGARWYRWLAGHRANVLARRSPVAFRLVFLLAVVLLSLALGVNTVFGALVAGICAARGDEPEPDGGDRGGRSRERQEPVRAAQAWEAIRQFAQSFFVPVFFALVGVRLDLAREFDVWFFTWFLLLACGVKTLSVWGAARLAGETPAFAGSLALALNARGTLGVILAGVTHQAEVISDGFFAVLVLVSVLTSQAAGYWLARRAPALRGPKPLSVHRDAPDPSPAEVS